MLNRVICLKCCLSWLFCPMHSLVTVLHWVKILIDKYFEAIKFNILISLNRIFPKIFLMLFKKVATWMAELNKFIQVCPLLIRECKTIYTLKYFSQTVLQLIKCSKLFPEYWNCMCILHNLLKTYKPHYMQYGQKFGQ